MVIFLVQSGPVMFSPVQSCLAPSHSSTKHALNKHNCYSLQNLSR